MDYGSTESPGPVVITGASGFIGSHLVEEFLREPRVVFGVDEVSPRHTESGVGRFEFRSLRLPSEGLSALLSTVRPSLVIHAAGPSSVPQSMLSPESDFNQSVSLTMGLLAAVRLKAPQARVIFLSSAAVYGNQPELPIAEDVPLAPLSPYGYHKAMGELGLKEYASVFGLRSCSVRIFSAYGPGLRRQVMWDICTKALVGNHLQLSGTGDESRDFVHVEDVARGIRLIAERAPMEGEAYNLASGAETTVAQVAHALIEALGSPAAVRFSGTSRPGDPQRWRADISRIARLGYVPGVEIMLGTREYANWFLASSARALDG